MKIIDNKVLTPKTAEEILVESTDNVRDLYICKRHRKRTGNISTWIWKCRFKILICRGKRMDKREQIMPLSYKSEKCENATKEEKYSKSRRAIGGRRYTIYDCAYPDEFAYGLKKKQAETGKSMTHLLSSRS